eukprot:6214807-Pleurochrysis_carterae.AAC.12
MTRPLVCVSACRRPAPTTRTRSASSQTTSPSPMQVAHRHFGCCNACEGTCAAPRCFAYPLLIVAAIPFL